MRTRSPILLAALAALAGLTPACGDDDRGSGRLPDGYGDYADENVTAIGAGAGSSSGDAGGPSGETGEHTPVLVGTPAGGGEVCFSDTLCAEPESDGDFCERDGGPVDVIYVDGEVVETVCYPPADDPDRPVETIDDTRSGDVEIVQMANNTTVVFHDDTDGTPFVGDIRVDGNNVAIYGNGADETIIDGEVTLDGNNVRLRGVTITGDLIIRKNNVAVVLSRILGDVVLETQSTNGSVFAENDIFGSFRSNSNDNIFVGNAVLGDWTVTGHGNTCDRNFAFDDADGDEQVGDEERGAALDCP